VNKREFEKLKVTLEGAEQDAGKERSSLECDPLEIRKLAWRAANQDEAIYQAVVMMFIEETVKE
jgi:hypothetical protein